MAGALFQGPFRTCMVFLGFGFSGFLSVLLRVFHLDWIACLFRKGLAMTRSYLPTREAELVTWVTNFDLKLKDDAVGYGLTVDQQAAYAAAFTAFTAAYQVANNPDTRSPTNIGIKNTKKQELIALTRELVDIAQASPVMDYDKRIALGISTRDNEPTPIPPPSEAPTIDVLSVEGWTLNIRLHDGSSTKRAKPDGVAGALVFTYVGDVAPVDVSAWNYEGSASKTETKVIFPSTLAPGTKVWLTAAWVNGKVQTGPAAMPVSRLISGNGLAQAA